MQKYPQSIRGALDVFLAAIFSLFCFCQTGSVLSARGKMASLAKTGQCVRYLKEAAPKEFRETV